MRYRIGAVGIRCAVVDRTLRYDSLDETFPKMMANRTFATSRARSGISYRQAPQIGIALAIYWHRRPSVLPRRPPHRQRTVDALQSRTNGLHSITRNPWPSCTRGPELRRTRRGWRREHGRAHV